MSGGPKPRRPDATDLARVRVLLESTGEPLTHADICRHLVMPPRVVWAAISILDGRDILLAGLPSDGYRVARFQGEGARRSAAIRSQAREMLQRDRRRRQFERTLPRHPDDSFDAVET